MMKNKRVFDFLICNNNIFINIINYYNDKVTVLGYLLNSTKREHQELIFHKFVNKYSFNKYHNSESLFGIACRTGSFDIAGRILDGPHLNSCHFSKCSKENCNHPSYYLMKHNDSILFQKTINHKYCTEKFMNKYFEPFIDQTIKTKNLVTFKALFEAECSKNALKTYFSGKSILFKIAWNFSKAVPFLLTKKLITKKMMEYTDQDGWTFLMTVAYFNASIITKNILKKCTVKTLSAKSTGKYPKHIGNKNRICIEKGSTFMDILYKTSYDDYERIQLYFEEVNQKNKLLETIVL